MVSAIYKHKFRFLKKLKLLNVMALEPKIESVLRDNGPLKNHFSLTGLYHHISKYGESIVRPTIIGIITVGLQHCFGLCKASQH
jgi:hypothetical protein